MNSPAPLHSAQPQPPLAAPARRPSTGWVLLIAAAALTAPSCKPPQKAAALPPPTVEVMTVTPTNVALTAEFIGQLDSPQNVEVRARIEAFVDEVLFTEGTQVKQGDPLFALDRKPFEERLAAAQGGLAEAKAGLNKYEKDVARLKPLAEKRAIPLQDLDNAVASVDVGKASVQSAEARLKSAQIDLGYCDIRAPVSGLIGAKQVSVGSLVGKGQPTLLATISTLHPIWFYCAISEVDFLRAERKVQETGRRVMDLPVTLILADGSELADAGKWVFVDRAVDVTTGTLRARAEFPNATQRLRPGMFARVRISLKNEKDSLLVPERALQELQGRNFVWVVGESNVVSQRAVKVGATINSDVIIQDGLKPGEHVVVEGVQKLREGAPVQVKTAGRAGEAAAGSAGPGPAAASQPAKE